MNAPLVEQTYEEIFREVAQGHTVPFVRDGRIIGYARPIAGRPFDPVRAKAAVEALLELKQAITARGHSATPEEIRADIEDGRE